MNDLTPIAYSNACPARYRNLTPRQECELRTARTGIAERPGGLPHSESYEKAKAQAATRRAAVIAKIKAGFDTRSKLRTTLNAVSWVDSTIEYLVTSGAIETIRVQNGKPWGLMYRVAQ